MARFALELEDNDDGTITMKLEASYLAGLKTHRSNTLTQNIAISIIEILKEAGLDDGQLPNLTDGIKKRYPMSTRPAPEKPDDGKKIITDVRGVNPKKLVS